MNNLNLLLLNTAFPWILLGVIGGTLACAVTVLFFLWKREKAMLIGVSALLEVVSSVPATQMEEIDSNRDDEEGCLDETEACEEPLLAETAEGDSTREEVEKAPHETYVEELERAKKKLKRLTIQAKQAKELREKLKNAEIEKKEAEEKLMILGGEMEKLQIDFAEYKEEKETELKNCKKEAEKEKSAVLADLESKYEELKKSYARSKEEFEALSEKADKYYKLLLQADARESELLKTLGSIRDSLIKTIGSESAKYLNEEIGRILTEIEEILKNF